MCQKYLMKRETKRYNIYGKRYDRTRITTISHKAIPQRGRELRVEGILCIAKRQSRASG